jgi:hypothetical protein
MRVLKLSLAGLVMLTLVACAGGSSRYPSLALRDVERRAIAAAEPSAPVPDPVSLDTARIAALQQSAQDAFDRFARQQPAAAALVARARGQSAESDLRARALVALADLTALRSATFVPLGELDALAADTAAGFGETAPITAAQTAVLALIAEQDRSLGALWGELGQ